MKIMQGADFLPCSNMSRTRLAPTPTNISTKSEPLMEKNGTSASPAMARASSVLPVPGGPTSSTPFGNAAAEFLKLLRVAQKLDQLLDFVLRFLDAGDVLEGDLVLIPRQHARLRFAEIQRAFAGHADLLAEKEIKNEQEERDRDEADDRLGEDVRLGPNRDRHIGRSQFLLQVGGEIQINGGPKRHLLRREHCPPRAEYKRRGCV